MIHMNYLMKTLDWRSKILEPFMPEMYSAENLSDFLKNMEDIQPTKRFLPFGCYFKDSALVWIESYVTYNSLDNSFGKISDFDSSLIVSLDAPNLDYRSRDNYKMFFCTTGNGRRLYNVGLSYFPKEDLPFLWSFDTYIPIEGSRKRVRNSLFSRYHRLAQATA